LPSSDLLPAIGYLLKVAEHLDGPTAARDVVLVLDAALAAADREITVADAAAFPETVKLRRAYSPSVAPNRRSGRGTLPRHGRPSRR
jgi:hypothetical protein